MEKIRRFLGAELDDPEGVTDGKAFSIIYQAEEVEFYNYDPSMIQKAADVLHLQPSPEYIVEVKEGSERSYFEATRRDVMEVLQQPGSEFNK